MAIARDIEEVRDLLEQAEREEDPMLKAHALEQAIALLDSCATEDLSPPERTLVANLRLAHTRRLLTQLVSLPSVSMEVWLRYIKLLLFELKNEVALALEQDPKLKENYQRFVGLWRQELLEALEALGEK